MDVYSDRTVNYFPISVATSLAIEGLVGHGLDENGNEWSDENKSLEYETIWINTRTLVRNVLGALPKEIELGNVSIQGIFNTVLEDINFIKEVLQSYAPHLRVYTYYCAYEKVERMFGPATRFRIAHTDKQLTNEAIHIKTQKLLRNYLKENDRDNYKEFSKYVIGDPNFKTIILTHYVFDLIDHVRFRKVTLLESHTGALKTKNKWYTKLYNSKTFPTLPLNTIILSVFGDADMIHPAKQRVKLNMLVLANERKWSHLTTEERIKQNIAAMSNKDAKAELLSFIP